MIIFEIKLLFTIFNSILCKKNKINKTKTKKKKIGIGNLRKKKKKT